MEKQDDSSATLEAKLAREPRVLYFRWYSSESVIAARPETGSAVVYNPQTDKWDYSDKDYFQIISDTNYDQISEAEAKSVIGDNFPKFGFLNLLDVLKKKRLERDKANE